jgi:hypothetical protein
MLAAIEAEFGDRWGAPPVRHQLAKHHHQPARRTRGKNPRKPEGAALGPFSVVLAFGTYFSVVIEPGLLRRARAGPFGRKEFSERISPSRRRERISRLSW